MQPNDIWQAHHTQLDVMVLNEHGRPARAWLTVFLDDRSRTVAGYTVLVAVCAAGAHARVIMHGRSVMSRRSCTATRARTSPPPTSARCAPISRSSRSTVRPAGPAARKGGKTVRHHPSTCRHCPVTSPHLAALLPTAANAIALGIAAWPRWVTRPLRTR